MRILIINHYAGSPRMGMELRPYYLAREWQKMGHEVLIVAASFSHLRAHQPETVTTGEPEMREGVNYQWIRVPEYKKNDLKRFVNMVAFVWKLKWRSGEIARSFKPDAVIASSTYPFDVLAARSIARRSNARLVFEVHDLWPLSPVELGGMSKWHPFVIATQAGENYACRKADKVVSILPMAKEHLMSHGMKEEKFVHVPNGIPEEDVSADEECLPEQHSKCVAELKKKNLFLIGYFGSHAPSDDLENLLRAAKMMEDEQVGFVLVGGGPEKASLMEKAAMMKLGNTVFLPFVPKQVVGTLMKEMDALYIGWKKRNLYRYGISPTKLMDYMVSGKPVIYAIEAGNNLVEEAKCGICAKPEDPPALRSAILELLNIPLEERQKMGARGRSHALKRFSYPALAKEFVEGIR